MGRLTLIIYQAEWSKYPTGGVTAGHIAHACRRCAWHRGSYV